jgi:hypothetical protein
MNYSTKITRLLADVSLAVSLNDDFEEIDLAEIAAALGCRSWVAGRRGVRNTPRINTPKKPDARYEALVSQALLEVFEANADAENDDAMSDTVLDGLLINDRWRMCINTAYDAYSFVRMLAIFYLGFTPLYASTNPLQDDMLRAVNRVTREWLRVDVAAAEMTVDAITRLAFGNVWCDLFLSESMSFSDVFEIVYAQAPPFMPGLLPHLEQAAIDLPSMSVC